MIEEPSRSTDITPSNNRLDAFQAMERRRSVRRFKSVPTPAATIRKAFEMAVLAPNSSNIQTWDFYWGRSEEIRKKLSYACYDQSPARTATDLIAVVADPKTWRRSLPQVREFIDRQKVSDRHKLYYRREVPFVYDQRFFNWLYLAKKTVVALYGMFKPINRTPWSRRDLEEVAIKSAALAAENFVIALSAQGYDSCMMEGFDEKRVRRILGLKRSARVVMMIGVGKAQPGQPTFERFRIPLEQIVHEL